MRFLYLIIIFGVVLNPLAAEPAQDNTAVCEQMAQMMSDSQHDCCDDVPEQLTSQVTERHDCDSCNDCKTNGISSCCLFTLLASSEPVAKQLAYLSIILNRYPTPIQVEIIPPIA